MTEWGIESANPVIPEVFYRESQREQHHKFNELLKKGLTARNYPLDLLFFSQKIGILTK